MDIRDLLFQMRMPDVTPEFMELHSRIEAAKASNTLTDELLNECDDYECSVCAMILCPHGDFLHFHHDGCPTCSFEGYEGYTDEQVEAMNASNH
jgi:hypothetical protein